MPPHPQNNRELSKDRERERERSGETETGVTAEVGEGKQETLEKVAWTVGGGISAAFFSSLEKYSCVALSVTDSEDDEEGEGTTPRPGFSDVMGQADGSSGAAGGELNLKGCERFVRHNPHTDLFGVQRFHHIEFWYAPAGEFS